MKSLQSSPKKEATPPPIPNNLRWPDDYLIPGIPPYHVEDAGIIYCGRSEEILWKLPPGSVDLTVTSPPYDNLREYKGDTYNFMNIANGLQQVIKKHSVIVWIIGDSYINGSESGNAFMQALFFKDVLGFNLHDTWQYNIGFMKSAKENFVFNHPAIYPEELVADHIYSWSNPGDIILDCHLGSGTTAKKAKELGRKFIGIEISEEYCAIAVKRLRQGGLNFE